MMQVMPSSWAETMQRAFKLVSPTSLPTKVSL